MSTLADLRTDPVAVARMIDSVFSQTPDGPATTEARESYLRFLAGSIEYLASAYPDRWGVTLFSNVIRLNVGMTECLVLYSGGLRILLKVDSAPVGFPLDGLHYGTAPGCDFTTLTLTELPQRLPQLASSHRAALAIPAQRSARANVKNAHSTGIIELLSKTLNRHIPNPSYVAVPESRLREHLDEVQPPELYEEGDRVTVMVNRYERDPLARKKCISHYGARCVVCAFSFQECYGESMADFIHVHHLTPISTLGRQGVVDPIVDLRPVCPNCHAVIHSKTPALSIEEVQSFLSQSPHRRPTQTTPPTAPPSYPPANSQS